MSVQLYRLHDTNPGEHGGCLPITRADAHSANRSGFGIFHTVNEFKGDRKIVNLVRIRAWALDLDSGTKDEMIAKINSGLPPTLVIETKNGFHVYFAAIDAKPKHWNSIVLDRLVPYYGADKNARDLARILRTPGYYHMKNPAEPFLIEKRFESRARYTEAAIAHWYPEANTEAKEEFKRDFKRSVSDSDNLWSRVYDMDCMSALERLSGHEAVGGESYSFRRNASGTYAIYVDGKSTSTWIDQQGRIGSFSKGGPTVFNWIDWFHKDARRTVNYMREVFPELWNK